LPIPWVCCIRRRAPDDQEDRFHAPDPTFRTRLGLDGRLEVKLIIVAGASALAELLMDTGR